jgi:hypothetical protein
MKTTHDFLPLQVPCSPSPERRAEKKRSGIYKEGYNFTFSFIYIKKGNKLAFTWKAVLH